MKKSTLKYPIFKCQSGEFTARICFFILLLLYFLPIRVQGQGWYNGSWLYRKIITIDYTKVGSGPHTNFPVVISIVDADLKTKALASGNDILFTSSDGTTKLNHEIEKYTSASGTLVAWVQVPSLSSAANTVLFMYYGNAGAANQQNVTGTWDANFKGVWHMNTVFTDATSNANNGTNTGTTATTGKISGGRAFLKSHPDYITITGLMGSPANVTLSAWASYTTRDNLGSHIISMGDYVSINAEDPSATAPVGCFYNSTAGWVVTPSSTNCAGAWHYFVYTFDDAGNVQKFYIDGLLKGTTTNTSSITYSGQGSNTKIGTHGNGNTNFDFDGSIDEVRVSNSSRSTGWILTEYNNQNSPSTFYSVGSEAKSYYSRATGNWNTAATWSNTSYAGAASTTTPGSVNGDYVDIGSSKTITLDVNITTNQTAVVVNSTGIFNMGTNTIGNVGTFTLYSGGTLGIGSTAGITSSGATGNVQVTGTRTFNTGGNYTYNGSSAQVTGNGLPTTVNNLTINNTSNITLNASATVNNTLTFSGGKIILGTSNLTINNSGSIATPSSSTYIVTDNTGTLIQNNIGTAGRTGGILFPVGTSASSYTPITITNTGTADAFNVRVFDNVYTLGTTGATVTANVVTKTWMVDEAVAGGSNVTLTAQWNGVDEATGFGRASCGINHYISSAWDIPTYAAAVGSDPYTISRSGISSFSPFAVSESGVILPIELLTFQAKLNNGVVSLNWITATEINNDYFTIEKTKDGINYKEVGVIDGAGNSSSILNYSSVDENSYDGISYYRLKQTDFDGKFTYSKLIAVNNQKGKDFEFKIFPNPSDGQNIFITSDQISTDIKEILVVLYDALGNLVYSTTILKTNNCFSTTINLEDHLVPGVYYMVASGENELFKKKLVVFPIH